MLLLYYINDNYWNNNNYYYIIYKYPIALLQADRRRAYELARRVVPSVATPNLPTKIIPAKRFADPNFPGKSPMGMRVPLLKITILIESNPLNSRILVLVQRLGVFRHHCLQRPWSETLTACLCGACFCHGAPEHGSVFH